MKTEEPKQDLEKEMFELEQELDIPSNLRWHNSKPKQETLEEVAEKFAKKFGSEIDSTRYYAFINGAKWQQEQDKNKYSEEDVRGMLEYMSRYVSTKEMRVGLLFGYSEWVRKRDWFVNHLIEQFKNK